DFITTYGGGNHAFVGFGGANIDTNGFNIGILVDLVNAGGGLTKDGVGTLTLAGINTYVGNTTINEGTLVLADDAQLTFVVDEIPASNMVTGAGTAIFHGDFSINTSAVTGNNGYIWTLVDRASLTGESFDPVTFSVIGFSDADDDGVWTMSDAKGDWSFDESTGELTLDVGNDYDDWGAPYGLAQGSETGDLDGDGLSNQDEYAFGLIPNSGASVNPIVVPLDPSTGTFRYTRRATPANTGLTYTVWTSDDLTNWTEDTTASGSQNVIGTASDVETVEVTLSGTLPLTQPRLFIQVRAN
nr:autotransporter-associated beta strand repeat-containing protein [Akkermansiaceae bacterium]